MNISKTLKCKKTNNLVFDNSMLNPIKGSTKQLRKFMEKWKRKGHFVFYSKDNTRFMVPLCYLNHPIFRVLLEMAEDEYGSTTDGPLQVPCEKELVEYILCLLRKNSTGEVEKPILSIAMSPKATFQRCNKEVIRTPVFSCGY